MAAPECIDMERVIEVAQDHSEYIGFCTDCGAEKDGCEPDARNYTCDECGADSVFGAEELLIMYA